jgi:hypothetical protein
VSLFNGLLIASALKMPVEQIFHISLDADDIVTLSNSNTSVFDYMNFTDITDSDDKTHKVKESISDYKSSFYPDVKFKALISIIFKHSNTIHELINTILDESSTDNEMRIERFEVNQID